MTSRPLCGKSDRGESQPSQTKTKPQGCVAGRLSGYLAIIDRDRCRFHHRAPNPNGCYVKVFDQPQLRGTADFINGPMRYVTLTNLPNGANWNDRIRSIEVGAGATATAWGDAIFTGASMELRVDTRYPTLPSALVGTIKSLDVRCTQAPASAP